MSGEGGGGDFYFPTVIGDLGTGRRDAVARAGRKKEVARQDKNWTVGGERGRGRK